MVAALGGEEGNELGFGGSYMNEDNFNGLTSGWSKIVRYSCRSTVPRVQPRPDPTIRLGRPKALSASCRSF
jgi:hypothetical protein